MGYLSNHHGEGPILSATIAAEMEIPLIFLSKILSRLAQAGLINTVRGRGGGVELARPGEDILFNEVVDFWLESIFEFFGIAVIALLVVALELAAAKAALRVDYFTAAITFISGIVGTPTTTTGMVVRPSGWAGGGYSPPWSWFR